jgi:hypothetical protein
MNEPNPTPAPATAPAAAPKPRPALPKLTKLKAHDPKSAEPSKPKILIFGRPGVGKTWWALSFPQVYYIDTEGGADLSHYTDRLKKSGGVYMGPDDGSNDLSVITEQVKALATEAHPYRTVVIDSMSKPFNTAISEEATRLGEKDQFGASKKPAIAAIRRLVTWLDKIDMNVILICHEKQEWGLLNGERAQTGVTFDCYEKLEYELHLCLRADKRGPERFAVVRKSRLVGFPDGDEFKLDYAEFAARYGKAVIEKPSQVIVLATAAEVAEVTRLLDIVKVSDEDVEKWFKKANVEAWNEMTGTQIGGVIGWLQKRMK